MNGVGEVSPRVGPASKAHGMLGSAVRCTAATARGPAPGGLRLEFCQSFAGAKRCSEQELPGTRSCPQLRGSGLRPRPRGVAAQSWRAAVATCPRGVRCLSCIPRQDSDLKANYGYRKEREIHGKSCCLKPK